jgi:hypothetical protein
MAGGACGGVFAWKGSLYARAMHMYMVSTMMSTRASVMVNPHVVDATCHFTTNAC